MIEIRDLAAGYPGKPVLRDVNLSVPRGKVTVLLGPNGCGKSTLLKAIIRINPHSAGRIMLDGEDITRFSPRQLAQKVTYLAQSRQVPGMSVMQMVLHGRFPYLGYPRRYRAQDKEIAAECLERLGILELQSTSMSKLSGGQRQKVYIAMALAQDTPVVLMDEPTTFLDVHHQMLMMQQARLLADCGKTVVMVLHDLPLAMQTADCVAVMERGEIVCFGEKEEVYASGCLDRVFGVRISRFRTETGWQYYYEAGK